MVIPVQLRRAYGLVAESVVLMEPGEEGILLRPASVLPTEVYTPQRKAQFLLNNAVSPRRTTPGRLRMNECAISTYRATIVSRVPLARLSCGHPRHY